MKLELERPTPAEVALEDEGPVSDLSHTAVSSLVAPAAFDPVLEDYANAFSPFVLRHDNEVLFRGVLFRAESDEQSGLTTLEGAGRGWWLQRGADAVNYQNTFVADAIADYWTRTTFDATVEEPQGRPLADDLEAQFADLDADLTSLLGDPADMPWTIRNDRIEHLPSSWFFEAEDDPATTTTESTEYSGVATGGDAPASVFGGQGGQNGDETSFTFTPEYDVPIGVLQVSWRGENLDSGTNGPPMRVELFGEDVQTYGIGWDLSTDVHWEHVTPLNQIIPAGTEVTCRFIQTADTTGSVDRVAVDCISVNDTRFNRDFDNTVRAASGNNVLDGPQPFANQTVVTGPTYTSTDNIGTMRLRADFDNTENGQFVGVSADGNTWEDAENSDTIEFTPPGATGTAVGRLALSRYGQRGESPGTGFNGQTVDLWRLGIDTTDRAVINDRTFTGTHLENLQQLHDLANMRFTINHRSPNRMVHSYPVGRDAPLRHYALDHSGDDAVLTGLSYTGSQTHSLTINMMFEPSFDDGNTDGRWLSADISDYFGFHRNGQLDQLEWQVRQSDGVLQSLSTTLDEDERTLVSGVIDLSVPEIRLYVDGNFVAQTPLGTADWGVAAAAERFVNVMVGSEGGQAAQAGTYASGVVSEVRVDHRVVEQTELEQMTNLGLDFIPLDNDTSLYLPMDEGWGDTAVDFSENGNDGIVASPTWVNGIGPQTTDITWTSINATRDLDLAGYANRVRLQGSEKPEADKTSPSDEYYVAIDESPDEIARLESLGVDPADSTVTVREVDPRLDSQAAVDAQVTEILNARIAERDLSGIVEMEPTLVPVGYRYEVPEFNSEALDLERVSFNIGTGELEFREEETFVPTLVELTDKANRALEAPSGGSAGGSTEITAHDLGGDAHLPDTLGALNSKVSDATLDDQSSQRPPTTHPLAGSEHSQSTLAALSGEVSDADLGGVAAAAYTSTNTTLNINQTTWIQIPWNSTITTIDPLFSKPSAEQVVFDRAGVYRVHAMVSYNSGIQRSNPGVKFFINGSARSRLALSGYVRNADGHNEGSNALTELMTVAANDTLTVRTQAFGNTSGGCTMRSGESVLIVEAVKLQ